MRRQKIIVDESLPIRDRMEHTTPEEVEMLIEFEEEISRKGHYELLFPLK